MNDEFYTALHSQNTVDFISKHSLASHGTPSGWTCGRG